MVPVAREGQAQTIYSHSNTIIIIIQLILYKRNASFKTVRMTSQIHVFSAPEVVLFILARLRSE
jgi:hypothetical protein